MLNINPGTLRHRLIIQRPVKVQDTGSGAVNITWQNVRTVWASIKPISAREFVASQAETSRITTRITVRYASDIDHTIRLFHAATGKYYDVHGELTDSFTNQDYITLPCSEGVKYQ